MMAVLLLCSCVPASSLEHGVPEDGAWRATGSAVEIGGFTGALTRGNIFQAWLLQPGLARSGVVGAVAGWEVAGWFASTGEQVGGIELEASASQHFGWQTHAELTLAGALRWHAFLFGDTLRASASVGQGVSWATATPLSEQRRWGNDQRLLSYNSYELTLGDPARPDVELVFRLHHRSGVFGLFGGVHEGSNVALMGLRYRFEPF